MPSSPRQWPYLDIWTSQRSNQVTTRLLAFVLIHCDCFFIKKKWREKRRAELDTETDRATEEMG